MEGFFGALGLESGTIIGLVLLLGFLYVMHRYRPKPVYQPLSVDIAWDAVAEPAETANSALRGTFDGMAGADRAGRTLLRVVIYNRGTRSLLADHYRTPVTITLPDAAGIDAARFSEAVKSAAPDDTETTIEGRSVILPRAPISAGGLLVFNIVADGSAEKTLVEADFDGQNGIYRLG